MFKSLKESWKLIREDPPGKRFRHQYRRRQSSRKSIAGKIVLIGFGVIIIVVGVVMLPAPGPGMLVIFIGLGLISQESLWIAVLLDKIELYLRQLFFRSKTAWNKTSVFLKIFIVFFILIVTAIVIYGAYLMFLSHE
jgi:uncharacterized protein (TIGR02611 family)